MTYRHQPYETAKPNADVPLGEDSVTVDSCSGKVSGQAHIVLRLAPDPRIEIRADIATHPDERPAALALGQLDTNPHLVLESRQVRTEVILTSVRAVVFGPESGRLTAIPRYGVIECGRPDALTSMLFHLFNFPEFFVNEIGDAGQRFMLPSLHVLHEGWEVRVTPSANCSAVSDELAATGGYALTHFGEIACPGAQHFSAKEAGELIDMLYYVFSFCRGLWAGPMLLVGYHGDGRVWESWGARQLDPYQGVSSWFDPHHGEAILDLLPGFQRLWDRADWRKTIRIAVHWFVSANRQDGGLEGSIVLTQNALELLGWQFLVKDRKVISSGRYKKSSAASNIRLLLKELRIPTAVPGELGPVAAGAIRAGLKDGPEVFTYARNRFVHPGSKSKLPLHEPETLFGIHQLGLWYLELAILSLSEYRGEYSYRLNRLRWRGQTGRVPWV